MRTWAVTVNCHRRLRGPYTGVGTMLRTIVPQAMSRSPELVAAHLVAILCAAPELEELIGSPPGTLTEHAPPGERTRWYSRLRTRRISHHLVDFLNDLARESETGSLALCFDTVDEADHTDQEFLAIALRRTDPALVRLGVASEAPDGSDLLPELLDALGSRTTQTQAPHLPADELGSITDAGDHSGDHSNGYSDHSDYADHDDEALLRAFIDSDGITDRPEETLAYYRARKADPQAVAALHRARAAELEARGEVSLTLGAILYHVRHGAERLYDAWPAYVQAEKYCMDVGFYRAQLELLDEMELILRDAPEDHDRGKDHHVYIRRGQVLALLDRQEEAMASYISGLADTRVPREAMALHYYLGMLYTRFQRPEHKDHTVAKAHLNTSVALASQIPEPDDRAFFTVFMGNGLALAEVHLGRLQQALELVDAGLARLDRELGDARHRLHRSVLRANRAQVLMGLKRHQEALEDFNELVRIDPFYNEYYFERGNARYQSGDLDGAMTDYDEALALGPMFPELFHNRGEAKSANGDIEAAIQEFRHALELEPDTLESRIALSSLLLETGAEREAIELIGDGLGLHPEDARLLCLLGQATMAIDDTDRALDALDRAVAADGELYQALAVRAALHYEHGRFDDAVADLDRALAVAGDDPDLLFNRGYAQEAAGRLAEAVEDYTRALELPGADSETLISRRLECRAQLSVD
ncbi:tetratricopeptide repeat protein [Catenulispora yoronensis]